MGLLRPRAAPRSGVAHGAKKLSASNVPTTTKLTYPAVRPTESSHLSSHYDALIHLRTTGLQKANCQSNCRAHPTLDILLQGSFAVS